MMNGRTISKRLVWASAALAVLGAGGCAAGAERVEVPAAVVVPVDVGSTRRVSADWDDVYPAVSLMAQQVEMALLDWSPGHRGVAAASEQRFALLTIGDEPAELLARRQDGGVIELSARVGRFGDARRERALVEAVARRLTDLAGVEVRPLR